MSSSSSPVLVLDLPRSVLRLLPAGLLLAASVATPWLSKLPWVMAMAVMLAGMSLVALTLWNLGFGRPQRTLVGITWQQSHEWQLRFANGAVVPARLLVSSWCVAGLMCLGLIDANGVRHQLMIWRIEVPSMVWHQWQLRLRLEGQSSPSYALGSLQ